MVKKPRKKRSGIGAVFTSIRQSFLAGLVIIAPIALTIYIIWTAVGIIDSWVLPFIPARYNPTNYILVEIRGIGLIIFIVFTLLVGYSMKGLVGRTVLGWGERLVDRTPIVRNVYNSIKHISETVLSQSTSSFEKACLIEYPRKGIWAVAFLSRPTKGEIRKQSRGDSTLVGLFVPTTPNPTSGFLLFVPKSEIIVLDMTIEDAIKLVISAGIVYPPDKPDLLAPTPRATKHRAGNQSSRRRSR